MSIADYMNLPYDLSGSLSKNRFRNELLWGLKRIFEIYKSGKDFTAVFDYKCDVELHIEDNQFEFYQLKTQNDNGTYTVNNLIKANKSGDSVLGKLYLLKYGKTGTENDDVLVALVSNAPFNDNAKVHTDIEKLDFLSIDNLAFTKIKDTVTQELKKANTINLKNTFFIRTSMDLINPEKTLIGELSIFFEEIFNSEAKKINSLYRLLYSEISTRASYELRIIDYDELLKRKGISRSELTQLLRKYIDHTDTAISKAKEFISLNYSDNFKMKVDLNSALNQILILLPESKVMQRIEKSIVDFINQNIEHFPNNEREIVDLISANIEDEIPIEMKSSEVKMLIIVTLKKFEEGMYEKPNY
ncbi:DUF4297 domain-containing protein [Paenibacillus oenotherae]|uniref:DUF4297 domain-containing protein n=1 Tax=Paenibacillus oenotherae TaxID=1435645 RepID=A0ABS7D603_9BACL|nr:dsDNA nuclease domain-containing protein [Paenibacillus oenotherae]MBW7475269.1 DUF4297 domain-containing protein [Paenibacillus oenotherae]